MVASVEMTVESDRADGIGAGGLRVRLLGPMTISRSKRGHTKNPEVLHELKVCGFYARVVKPGRVASGDA